MLSRMTSFGSSKKLGVALDAPLEEIPEYRLDLESANPEDFCTTETGIDNSESLMDDFDE